MFRALILSGLVFAIAALLPVAPASAAVSCHSINSKGTGQDLGGGQTIADINGGGILNGTTAGDFAAVPNANGTLDISGTVTFTTKHGTLTVTVTGTLNPQTGQFTASGPASASSGKLAGASGSLTLTGTENLETGAFTETIVGNICVDLAP